MTSPYTYTFEDIQNRPVAVIGAGTLGRRIALMLASRGGTLRIYARRAEQRAEATQYVTENLSKFFAGRGFGEIGTAVGAVTRRGAGRRLACCRIRSGKARHQDPAVGRHRPGCAARHHLRHQLVIVPVAADGRKRPRQNAFVQYTLLHAAAVQCSGPDVGRPDRPRADRHPADRSARIRRATRSKRARSAPASSSTGWAAIKRECSRWSPKGWPSRGMSTGCSRSTGTCRPGRSNRWTSLGWMSCSTSKTIPEEFRTAQERAGLVAGYVDVGKLGIKTGEGFYTYPAPIQRTWAAVDADDLADLDPAPLDPQRKPTSAATPSGSPTGSDCMRSSVRRPHAVRSLLGESTACVLSRRFSVPRRHNDFVPCPPGRDAPVVSVPMLAFAAAYAARAGVRREMPRQTSCFIGSSPRLSIAARRTP